VALKGLVIDQPWIGKILNGEKVWEMRSRATSVRGEIALIAKGTGTIVGFARLVDCLPALRREEMSSHFAKHGIPPEMVRSPGFKWFTPWVLADVRRAERPFPYDHPSGAVIWVNLSSPHDRPVASSRAPSRASASEDLSRSQEDALASRVLSQIEDQQSLNIPADARRSVRRVGNKLYIDVEWDDGSPSTTKSSGWLKRLLGNR
jgi:hypothetical protein